MTRQDALSAKLAFVKGCSAGTSTKTGSGPLKPCSLRYSAMNTEYVDVMKPTKRCRGGHVQVVDAEAHKHATQHCTCRGATCRLVVRGPQGALQWNAFAEAAQLRIATG